MGGGGAVVGTNGVKRVAAVLPAVAVVVAQGGLTGQAARALFEPDREKIFITGIVTLGGVIRVCLSDGRMYSNRDLELQWVSKEAALISGRLYRFRAGG